MGAEKSPGKDKKISKRTERERGKNRIRWSENRGYMDTVERDREEGGKERGQRGRKQRKGNSKFQLNRRGEEGREIREAIDGEHRQKYLFWNIAGIENKNREFWKYVREFEIVSMCETWLEEEEWENIKDRLHESYE